MKYLQKHPGIVMVIGILGISLSSIFIKYSTAPSSVSAAWRLLWTVAILSPVVFGRKESRRELLSLPKKELLFSVLSGLFLAIHFAFWFESLKQTTVASAATIVCTEVIWVSLGYCLFLKGKLPWKAAASIAVALAGSVCIAWSDSGTGGSHLYGDVLALLAAAAVAVYVLLGRVVQQKVSTTVYTYVVYVSCAAALTALCLAQGVGITGHGPSPIIVGVLLAVFSTLLGHSIFSWCLKYFTPSFVSAAKLMEPVVASVLAAFLFREIPTALQLLGGALILSGLYTYAKLEQ